MHEHGLSWCDGSSYLNMTNWDCYKKDTVYYPSGTYGNLIFATGKNRTILNWSDYMK